MPYNEPFQASLPEHRKQFNSTRLAGVEWEFNGVLNPALHIVAWCEKWRGVRKIDGSCGYEMMTAPIAGDHISNCLQELGEAFQKDQATINKACGLHVHVNCLDFSWEDIYRLMWVYSQVEDVLFQLGGEWRKQCQWAYPIGVKCRDIVRERFQPTSTTIPDVQEMSRVVCNAVNRRFAFNMWPWLTAKRNNSSEKPTVEFRIHENTDDASRVIGWTQLLVEMIDWVKSATDLRASRLSKNPIRALCKMAPQSRKWILQQFRMRKNNALQQTIHSSPSVAS